MNWDDDQVCSEQDLLLIRELYNAEDANVHARPCQMCAALLAMSERVRTPVERALAGTIGEIRLAEILTNSGYPVGRRAVRRHRQEGHDERQG